MNLKNPILPALLSLAFCVCGVLPAPAQALGRLPAFSMTLANGRYFNATEIRGNKPVLLIYFDPECDHCHTLMNGYFQRPADFAATDVLMVTYKPLKEVQAFAQNYQTHRFPNIRLGTEGTSFYLRNYFRMQSTPFVVLYDAQGKPVAGYQKEVPLDALRRQVKNS